MKGRSTTPAVEELPRICVECGQHAPEPGHSVITDLGQMAEDGVTVLRPVKVIHRHHDCCASIGCTHDEGDARHCKNVLAAKAGA